jgi:putative selenate reductase
MTLRNDRDASGRKIPHEVPDSDFEVPLDTLIMAISQHAVLDFFDDAPIAINDKGYIAVDPETFETSVPGVYAGGDVANSGPSSIVKAAAAGKAIADSILARHPAEAMPNELASFDTAAVLRQRSHRQWRVPTPQTPLRERRNFNEVVLTYTERQAHAEAARCLNCDRFCSICVSVCPNLALQTYQTQPFAARLPMLKREGEKIETGPGKLFRVGQSFQVAVLKDWCNDCGNCTTFCPTSGQPYRDKPRLYIDRTEFEAQKDNAFRIYRNEDHWAMDARCDGATHRIELNGDLDYTGPLFSARINPDTFAVTQIEPNGNGNAADDLSLEQCATMYVLLNGLQKSMPHLPTAQQDDPPTTGWIGCPDLTHPDNE